MKLKMNNGFTTFKDSKRIQPLKFEFKHHESGGKVNLRKKMMKKTLFMDNPDLIEFANKNQTNIDQFV